MTPVNGDNMDFRQTVIKVPALLLCSSPCFVLSSRLDFIFTMAPFAEQDESPAISSPAAHTVFHLMVQGDCLSSSCCICLLASRKAKRRKEVCSALYRCFPEIAHITSYESCWSESRLGLPRSEVFILAATHPTADQGSVPRKEGQWVMRAWARWLQEC